MSELSYFAVCQLEGIYPGAYVRCLGARDTMSGCYDEGGIYRVTEDLDIIGDDGMEWRGDSGCWELVNDEINEKEPIKVFDNPLVDTKPYIVELDANLPEFDHITVEIGEYDRHRVYLRIGGVGSFEHIDKQGLKNLSRCLSEVADLLED